MNINFTEVLILKYLLNNKDKTINEYHIFKNIKEFDISSSEMVVEIIKLKSKKLLEEIGEENKKLVLTPSGLEYARNVVKGRLEYITSIKKFLTENENTSQPLAPTNESEEVAVIVEDK